MVRRSGRERPVAHPVRLARSSPVSGGEIRLTTGRPGSMLADVTGTADHVLRNRAVWDGWASDYAGAGLRNWSAAEPAWGIWGIAEAQAGVLPSGLDGADSIELGCGTGYVSAWLAR